jgi:hypothetical protein
MRECGKRGEGVQGVVVEVELADGKSCEKSDGSESVEADVEEAQLRGPGQRESGEGIVAQVEVAELLWEIDRDLRREKKAQAVETDATVDFGHEGTMWLGKRVRD